MAHDRDEAADTLGILIPIGVILFIVGGIALLSVVMVMRARDVAAVERAMAAKKTAALQQAIAMESMAKQQLETALIAERAKANAPSTPTDFDNAAPPTAGELAALPKIAALPRIAALPKIVVQMNHAGVLSIDEQRLDQAELMARITDLKKAESSRVSVRIEAHPNCPAKHIAALFSVCRELDGLVIDVVTFATSDSGPSSDRP